jgi:hypothetical protein
VPCGPGETWRTKVSAVAKASRHCECPQSRSRWGGQSSAAYRANGGNVVRARVGVARALEGHLVEHIACSEACQQGLAERAAKVGDVTGIVGCGRKGRWRIRREDDLATRGERGRRVGRVHDAVVDSIFTRCQRLC